MKKLYIVFIILILGITGKTQNIQVIYREQTKLPSNIEGVDDPLMLEAIKAQIVDLGKNMTLTYANGESIYKEQVLNELNEQSDFSNNTNVVYSYAKGIGGVYKNQKTKQIVSQEYILDKSFLIIEPLLSCDWQITQEEKIIENHTCVKAVSGNLVAWYCPEIPIPDGPSEYSGLPGLIMEIETEFEKIFVKTINLSYSLDKPIVPPKEGKKISREKYEKTLAKKMKNQNISDDNTVKFTIE